MKSFVKTDPQSHQGNNIWFTPKNIIDFLGPFDLDPCSVSYRPFDTAKKHFEHDKGDCGLSQGWAGDVWLNPPYGKEIMPFVEKFIKYKKGVMLIFARMGSESVQKLIKSGACFYFLRKRVCFINKNGSKESNAGCDSCIVFYDHKYIDRLKKIEGVFLLN